MKDCNVSILGTEYRIEFKEMKNVGIDGYCDYTSKHIVIRSDNENELEDFEYIQKKQLRHEIVHAFMAESGLQSNWNHTTEFGHEETTVDWFAIQSPKIFSVFTELGLIDIDDHADADRDRLERMSEAVVAMINDKTQNTGQSPIVV